MKKTIFLFFVMLTIVAMGQKKNIRSDTYDLTRKKMDIVFEDAGKYHFYYDENDNKVLHGKKSGSVTEKRNKLDVTLSEEMNYNEGKLDGALHSKTYLSAPYLNLDVQINGFYKDGEQDGIWSISEKINVDRRAGLGQSGNVDLKCKYTYDKGIIIGFKLSMDGSINNMFGSGDCNLRKNKSGTWSIDSEKLTVRNGVKIGYFIGSHGYEREVDDEQREIIEYLVKADGKYDIDSILEKGYALNKYTEKMNAMSFDMGPFDFTDQFYVVSEFDYTYYILKRVKLASMEEIKNFIDEWVSMYNPNEITLDRYLEYLSKIVPMIKEDIDEDGVIDRSRDNTYYIKPSYKQSIYDYLEERYTLAKNNAEEKQKSIEKAKEQERIAREEERIARENAWRNSQEGMVNERFVNILVPWSKATGRWNKYLVEYRFIDIKDKEYADGTIHFDYRYLFAYELDIKDGGGNAYSTYNAAIEVVCGTPRSTICNIVNFQRDFNNAKRINNIYDTVDAMEKKLLAVLDENGMRDIEKVYKKGNRVKDIKAEVFSEYKQKLRQQRQVINYCYKFMTLRKEIAKNHNELTENKGICERYKDILGLYTTYYKTMDLGWNPSEDETKALATLSNIVKNQETYRSAMNEHKTIEATNNSLMGQSSECKNVVKAYSAYFKNADKAWEKTASADELVAAFSDIKEKQAGFIDCIEQYKVVSSKNETIVKKSQMCKNIAKIYKAYYKECEKNWAQTTDPAVLKAGLEKMLEKQEAVLAAISGNNVSELDKKVKDAKCKDLEAMLSVIK